MTDRHASIVIISVGEPLDDKNVFEHFASATRVSDSPPVTGARRTDVNSSWERVQAV